MIVIDSSFFVSLFVHKDVNHKKALHLWEDLRRKGIKAIAPTLLLPEVCGVIARVTKDKKYANEVKKMMERWLKIGVLVLKELTVKRANVSADISINFNLKGADAIFVSLAQEFNLKFITFDKEIKRKMKNKIEV